jgi:hypothetical protein
MGVVQMATKSGKSSEVKSQHSNGFVGYVNRRISREEKKAFDAWAKGVTLDVVLGVIDGLVENEYKFSAKRDHYGGGIQVALTCNLDTSQDFGLCLTARAPDFFSALALAVYKHGELLGGEWFAHYKVSQEPDEWG